MKEQLKQKIKNEILWLIGIGSVAAALEYAIITLMDLHPVISIKIQGFIGLLVIAYLVRMIARVRNSSEQEVRSETNGEEV